MDYNMSVGVRGGAFDIAHVRKQTGGHACLSALSGFVIHLPSASFPQFGWVCYLPLALVCPPGIYLAHRTSNFVYSVRVCLCAT